MKGSEEILPTGSMKGSEEILPTGSMKGSEEILPTATIQCRSARYLKPSIAGGIFIFSVANKNLPSVMNRQNFYPCKLKFYLLHIYVG
jgi:hypothetical protein